MEKSGGGNSVQQDMYLVYVVLCEDTEKSNER
jgi:hypothetical protein